MAIAKKLPFLPAVAGKTSAKGAAAPFPPAKSGKKGAGAPTMPAPKGTSAAKPKKGMCPACLKAKKKTCTH